jgi:nicotinamidase/pyrazinamidase
VQRDFLPGGALAVPGGEAVVAPLNAWIGRFAAAGGPVFATRDWHPPDHCSFAAQGGPWPPHCVARSAGATFAPGLQLPQDCRIVSKATRRDRDAYSGFDGTDLADRLRARGVQKVWIGGLATDYCVRATTLDALREGFEAHVLVPAVRAVEVQAGDGRRALEEMRAAGAILEPSGPDPS